MVAMSLVISAFVDWHVNLLPWTVAEKASLNGQRCRHIGHRKRDRNVAAETGRCEVCGVDSVLEVFSTVSHPSWDLGIVCLTFFSRFNK